MTRVASMTLIGLMSFAALTGCVPTEPGPADGSCEPDERICAGDQEFQRCVDGEWSEPQECPPEGEPPVEIRTFCNNGLCSP